MANGQPNKVPLNATLQLQVLGGASLSYLLPNQEVTQVLGAGKPLALLVYLAHLPNRTATRDHVIDLLWANREPSTAKPALRQAIWYIRQRIGDKSLEAGDGVVRLTLRLESDADRFEAAVDDGDLERAVSLYEGPFLPDLAIPGGAEFEHWANAERTRLEALFFRTAEIVTRTRLSHGQFQQAEKLARKVRDMNRLRQAGWRLLLEALTSAGDAVRAGVEAGELERVLAENGLTPARATDEAIRFARQLPAAPETASGRTLVAELVGREREFAAIVKAATWAREGIGSHLTITGGAGFGKTRLLTDAHMRLNASGIQTIHLRANVGERKIEYALACHLAELLSQLPGAKAIAPACAASLVQLNPALSSVYDVQPNSFRDTDELRTRTIALWDLLAAVSHEQMVALLIDDLHWTDEPSRHVLGGLCGSVQNTSALIVTASRPAARGPIQDTAQQELILPPLTLEHTVAMASSLGSLPDAEWVQPALSTLHNTTGGSPLLILESLQLAIDLGTLTLSRGEWSCEDQAAVLVEFEQGGALRYRVTELDRSESWVLLLLAVAGMPLSLNQLERMSHRSELTLTQAVGTLEQRGFIARVADQLEPTHDEIGALAIETASDEAISAASEAAGLVLAGDAGGDDHLTLRAGQLLAAAGDSDRLHDLFAARLWNARNRGERRSSGSLAREFLGERYTSEASSKLLRGLPLHFRLGLTSVRRVALSISVTIIAACVVVAALLWPDGPPPDVMLFAFNRSEGLGDRPHGTAIFRERFAGSDAVRLRRTDQAPSIDLVHGTIIPSPDGSSWAFNRLTADTGEIDVFVVDADGTERRITNTPNDDGVMDWSPDGRYLLVTSSRWDPDEFYEIAAIEVATGAVFRLTNSYHTESQPRWSPDGTRIGYLRAEPGNPEMEFCWTTLNASPPECIKGSKWFAGWHDANSVLVTVDSGGTRWLGRLNLDEGRLHHLYPVGTYQRLDSSSDGRWMLGFYRDSISGENRWSLFPTDAPELAREVSHPSEAGDGYELALVATDPQQRHLNSIEVERPSTAAAAGVPMLLQASGYDAAGGRVPLTTLKWSGPDTEVAWVNPRGVLHPLSPGSLTVHVDAGGWRRDSATIHVVESHIEVVATEEWTGNWLERWDRYGDPLPIVTTGPDSITGFWNNGDRSFTSGVYSLSEWSVSAGLGVAALVSTTITNPFQQTMALSLSGWMDTEAIAAWDHVSGYLPGRSNEVRSESCALGYPNWNSVLDGTLMLHVGRVLTTANGGPQIHTGAWHSVIVQIFPDGTCGIAVNGTAIARSTARVPLGRPYRLWTEGRSIGEKMLVGPLELWTGVQTDIDWAALDWPE